MLRALFYTALILMTAACAAKKSQTVDSADTRANIVALTLGQAAEQAHGDLAMLAKLRGQGMEPLLSPPSPELQQPVTIAWTGPASGVIQQICLSIGYRYRELGTPNARPVTVVVRGTNRQAYDVLEDIAWQIQPQAAVKVDPFNRVLTLATTNGRDN